MHIRCDKVSHHFHISRVFCLYSELANFCSRNSARFPSPYVCVCVWTRVCLCTSIGKIGRTSGARAFPRNEISVMHCSARRTATGVRQMIHSAASGLQAAAVDARHFADWRQRTWLPVTRFSWLIKNHQFLTIGTFFCWQVHTFSVPCATPEMVICRIK